MNKHNLIISGIVVFGLVVALGVSFYIIYTPPKEATPASASNLLRDDFNTKVDGITEDFVYKDDAGFTFGYPGGIVVSDKTEEDSIYYTLLSLVRGEEVMTISIKDTEYKSDNEWLSDDDAERELVGAVSLDGVSARQYVSSDIFLTVAVDQGVLYRIESPRDPGYWDKVHDIFVNSFKFDDMIEEVTKNSTSSPADSGSVIYEEEKVIY